MRKPILDMSRVMSSESTVRFVESRFDESIFLLRFMVDATFSKRRCPWDCPKLPQVHSVQQPLTQNQMRELCESIQQNVNQDYTYTVINFGEGHQVWNSQEFSLFETAIKMKIVGCETQWNKLHEDDSNKVTIFVRGGEYKESKGFLKYTEVDGTEQFFELEEFSLLSLVMSDLVDEEKINSKEELLSNMASIFMLYNRQGNSLFIDNTSLCVQFLLDEITPVII